MRHKLVSLAVTLAIASLASTASAHHSHPIFYDECRPLTIEGRIERVEFRDPHTLIFVTLDDGTAYTVDWAGLRMLTNSRAIGPAREALVAGARVVVTGNQIRPLSQIKEHFPDYAREVNPNTVDLLTIRRVGGSYSWARPPRTTPLNCSGK